MTYGRHTCVTRDLGILLHVRNELGVESGVVAVDLLCILGHLVSVTNVAVGLHLGHESGELETANEDVGFLLFTNLVIVVAAPKPKLIYIEGEFDTDGTYVVK